MKYFSVYNLGCRVNAAESNLFAQTLLNQNYLKNNSQPDLIFVNTCSVTAKANVESLGLIRRLQKRFPQSKIIVSGCADMKNIHHVIFLSNTDKETKLNILKSLYNPKIGDKFSHTHRYLLKVQSGCTAACSYCTVPLARPYLWSLPISDAVDTVNQAIKNSYSEIIITGVNLNQYAPGFSNLLEALLTQTTIPLISFGSLPLLCIDDKFIKLITDYSLRVTNYLHIPLQSGSNKILKLMNRPYTRKDILNKFKNLKSKIIDLTLGTDIIVGFPGETDADFKETYNLCKEIGFQKIHVFRFSPRPNTLALKLSSQYPTIPAAVLKSRSHLIQSTQIQC